MKTEMPAELNEQGVLWNHKSFTAETDSLWMGNNLYWEELGHRGLHGDRTSGNTPSVVSHIRS